jgi:hypothetical protein
MILSLSILTGNLQHPRKKTADFKRRTYCASQASGSIQKKYFVDE